MKINLRHTIFWPPFLLVLMACALSFVFPQSFLATVTKLNDVILSTFGHAFIVQILLAIVTCLLVMISPLGSVRIGGSKAKPLLTRWRWFAITLCTTVAVGILFWSAAEPIYHMQAPPASLGLAPLSHEAFLFAQSTMYLHWSFIPYALYSVPTVVFALAFYNEQRSFSLRSLLFPLKKVDHQMVGNLFDILCLYALVLGMAASLGTGVMTLNGGLNSILGTSTSSTSLAFITLLIVTCFCLSASTGLMKGIRILSDLNTKVFFLIAAFVFVMGNTRFMLSFGWESFIHFLQTFLTKATFMNSPADISWSKSWSLFYWANWLAWAPITALFLGKLAYGYSVRQCLLFTWLIPSLFSCVWVTIFSGQVISLQKFGTSDMPHLLANQGSEAAIYEIFRHLPFSSVLVVVFILTAFLSYVTAADSNTEALGLISTTQCEGHHDDRDPPSPWPVKITWGILIGFCSWIMVSFSGLDGIKMLSNLGGFVALVLVFTANVGLLKMVASRLPSRQK